MHAKIEKFTTNLKNGPKKIEIEMFCVAQNEKGLWGSRGNIENLSERAPLVFMTGIHLVLLSENSWQGERQ